MKRSGEIRVYKVTRQINADGRIVYHCPVCGDLKSSQVFVHGLEHVLEVES